MLRLPAAATLQPSRSVHVHSEQPARHRTRTRCAADAHGPSDAGAAAGRRGPHGEAAVSLGRRGLLQLASCACCAQLLPATAAEWSYGDAVPIGVAGWPAVSKTCAAGGAQSPVDLRAADVAARETRALTFNYAASSVTVSNPHGGPQVGFAPAQATAKLGERKLELLQFHFHTPSEHALDGNRLAMEAHLVHRDTETGALAVLGVLMRSDAGASPNACLAAALAYGPEVGAVVDAPVRVNPAALLPSARTFFEYRGSLTTPPCSEEVLTAPAWFEALHALIRCDRRSPGSCSRRLFRCRPARWWRIKRSWASKSTR